MMWSLVPALLLSGPQPAPSQVPYSDGNLRLEALSTSLEFPWGMEHLPDGRLLITEKPGRLRILDGTTLSAPVTGVPKVAFRDQGGLLDVEVDPDFATNGFVYLFYSEPASKQPANPRDPWDKRLGPRPKNVDTVLKGGAVARGRLDGNALRDVKVIWRQNPKTIGRGHFGGRMTFGPDGKLWISSGDRQRFTPAQSRTGNLGKIVRINPDGTFPPDNPFPRTAIADVWTIGHRNSLAFAFQPGVDKLWAAEMGPLHGDELNLIQRGANYGWPTVSNGMNYDRSPIPDHSTMPRFTKPRITWTPVISPSGMVFLQGEMFPSWRGQALIGGLSSKSIVRVSFHGGPPKEEERINLNRRIRDVTEAPDGSILFLTDAKQGAVFRLSR